MNERPDWWERNAKLRDEMDLQSYEPPQFEDGTYVHIVVDEVERDLGCSIRFVAEDPTFPSVWAIEVDGEQARTLQRQKTERGNVVYPLGTDEFVEIIEIHVAK